MKEKEIIERCEKFLYAHYPQFVMWRAPAYQKRRWDIFTIFDLIVVTNVGEVIFIQCTTHSNVAARRKKIQAFFSATNFEIPNSYIYSTNPYGSNFWHDQYDRFEPVHAIK